MADYIERPMKDYLADLAARKPAPGGGSAAALAGSLGLSLMSMVLNYTVGNPKFKDSEAKAAAMLTRVEKMRADLQGQIDKDVRAYSELSKAMKEYKDDAARLDAAYKEAVRPPYEICRITGDALIMCDELVALGNKSLVTDTAIAAIMLEGAFLAAKYNVYINLKYIKDIAFIEGIHKMIAPLEERLPKLKEDILEKCEDAIQE
jgi:methenyltetrahydrofolate cyclohydrolase